ncbi:winged helix-turn-helix domain-containing protein [Hamadaea sp. NPDC051192]|uniref:winged helix-turn-helix domain-containing protein n=1 Tax=Hamadaea sp. NPDC051192 TaxID=3154940 RepID=UPI0034168363
MLTSSIEHDWRNGVWLAWLAGEFARDGHVRLRRIVSKCLSDDPAGIVVDLTEVTSVLPMLPTALATEQRRAARSGVSLVYVLPEDRAAELKSGAAGRHLIICPTVAAARFLAGLVTPHRWLHLALDSRPQSMTKALDQTRAACLTWGVPDLAAPAESVTAELVTNALSHVGGVVRLTVSLQQDLLRIRVHDRSRRVPILAAARAEPVTWDQTTGLERVAQYAAAWGARAVDDGKIVWATVRAQITVLAPSPRPAQADARHTEPPSLSTALLVVGGLTLDCAGRQAWLDGRLLHLSDREYDLLSYLMHHPDMIVSKKELLTNIWHRSPTSTTRTLDVHLCWLRQKLDDDIRAPRYLHTVRGLGIRLSAPPVD